MRGHCLDARVQSQHHLIIGSSVRKLGQEQLLQVMIEYYAGPRPELAAGAGSSTPNSVPMANLAIGA